MHLPNHSMNRHGVGFCLSEIFTPAFCRKLNQVAPEFNAHRERWFLKPLCLVGLFVGLASGRTLGARFNEASRLVSKLFPKTKRAGEYLSGFQAAVSSLPQEVIAQVRAACQSAVLAAGRHPALVGRHLAFGVDGTKQEAPRTPQNEEYFGVVTKLPALPLRLVATCFGLGERLLWDWAGGPGNASEADLILEIIQRGPAGALYVKDAGMVGYDWFRAVLESRHHLLMRVGGNFSLWVEHVSATLEQGGRVLLWPQDRRSAVPPLALRLITYQRHYVKRRHGKTIPRTETVYLVTDLPAEELTQAEAEHLFALRWPGNEIGHRGWKRTLSKHKLLSERPRNAEKESEFSLLACMFLQALVLIAQGRGARDIPSVAQALDVWGEAVQAVLAGRAASWLRERLRGCVLDHYVRQGPKVLRSAPQRKEHKPLKPPILRELDNTIKALLATMLGRLGVLQV
jgi:hypothetical protein